MPTPTIPDGELFMNATLYTGTGSTRSVANGNPGQSFQPDFVWIKERNNAVNHLLYDSVRGVNQSLTSNSTGAEVNYANSLTAFTSTGFTVGTASGVNDLNDTYVGWNWKAGGAAVTNTAGTISSQVSANTTSGFSVVTYTGNGTSSQTCGHGLGVTPAMVIWKNRNDADAWIVYHNALTTSEYLILNTTAAKATFSGLFTGISSTVLPLNNASAAINANGFNYVAYCFAEIAGYSAFGSYTGNGSTDGTFVYTGFRPRFVMIKVSSGSTGPWNIIDTARDPFNLSTKGLYADLADAEDSSRVMDVLSNGFKFRGTPGNTSGATFIYMAFAENPFKYANAR